MNRGATENDSESMPAEAHGGRAGQQPATAAEARTKIERVLWVRDVVVRGEWEPGASSRRLAAAWGCSVKTVEAITSEAHRMLRAGLSAAEVEDFRAMAAAFHRRVAATALAAGEFGAATRAMQAFTAIVGVGGAAASAARPVAQADASSRSISFADLERMAAEIDAQADEKRRCEAEATAAKAAEAATSQGEDEDDDDDDGAPEDE